MTRLATIGLALVICAVSAAAMAQFGPSQYAIKDGDGDPVSNFDLGAEMSARLAKLPGKVEVGNLQGEVTVLQFYDLNCPYCRQAAADVNALVSADRHLKLVFVPYAVLSMQSLQGALVELAAAKMLTPEKFLQFHNRIYASRGVIDAPRVLAAAEHVGLDQQQLAAAANTESTLEILKSNATFGSAARLVVTPAYVVNNVAILGHPGLKSLQGVIHSVRACGKVAC